jgi:hypothetical protein
MTFMTFMTRKYFFGQLLNHDLHDPILHWSFWWFPDKISDCGQLFCRS